MLRRKLLACFMLLIASLAYADTTDVPVATFAGGNFWYMQRELDLSWGVMQSEAGYSGGVTIFPTYEQVATGDTKHVETVQIVYSPQLVSYEELLDIYFENIDPIDPDGQFCHKGSQYAPKIFYHSDAQRVAAEKKLQQVKSKFRKETIVVQILPYTIFFAAEPEYQLFYKRRPFFYKFMETWCGRPKRLKKLWGD